MNGREITLLRARHHLHPLPGHPPLGARFRQRATRVLREHLTQGYSLHAARLAQRGLTEAQQAIDLLVTSDPNS